MLRTRLINAVFYLAIVAGLIVLFVVVLPFVLRLTRGPKTASTTVVLQQVQTLSKLVTVKYVMEKVVIHEGDATTLSEWVPSLAGNRVLMVAHGIVLAGIDLSEIKQGDIQISGEKLTLKLPPARVVQTSLDEDKTQVVDYKQGLLRRFDKNLEQAARQQAVLDINRAARDAGILKDADERVGSQLTNLFLLMGYKEVEFRSP